MTESQIAVLPCPFCGTDGRCGPDGAYYFEHAKGCWIKSQRGTMLDCVSWEELEQWNARNPLKSLENFIDRQIECMDESGQWMTHAIDALLVLQSRIDEILKQMGCPGQ
jgi:hypothetical protein